MYAEEATTIASHAVMLILIAVIGVRAMRRLNEPVDPVTTGRLAVALAVLCLALGIERAFYLAARLVAHTGENLWRAHPIPELLSLIVTCGLFGLMIPLILRSHPEGRAALARIGAEVGGLVVLWGALVWWLI